MKYLATVTKAKKTPATIETLQISDLPVKSLVKQSPGICDTIVNVKYSNLNYKDALVSWCNIHKSKQIFYETESEIWAGLGFVGQLKIMNFMYVCTLGNYFPAQPMRLKDF